MDIYEILQDMDSINTYRFLSREFSDTRKKMLTSEKDKELFDLIKNISSLSLKTADNKVEFLPEIKIYDVRTFSIEDLTDYHYSLLKSLDLSRVPLIIKARICDIIWCRKEDFTFAKSAVEAYFELFNLWFRDNDWLEAIDIIKRAIDISAQTKQDESYNKCCQTVYNHIIRIGGKDSGFLSMTLIEIILKQRDHRDFKKIIDILDNIISINTDNPNKTEQAFLLKCKVLNKMKKKKEITQSNLALADYFVKYGENVIEKSELDACRAQYYFEKAIKLYRDNSAPEKAEKTHKRLVEIQKIIPKTMGSFKIPFNGNKIVKNIKQNMENLSFEESIIRFTQMIDFYKKEEFKEKVIEEIKQSPISHMFTKNIINSDGQTVFSLPPLDINHLEENLSVLDMHICNKMYEFQSISGNMYIGFAMSYIKRNYDVQNESFDFIIDDNIIIPEDRKEIFRLALRMAFQGDCYGALHMLAPQIENVFRYIAKEAGALTVTLENNGTSKEKVLGSIFKLPELIDCYDNDILFLFEGLLNNPAGANIRNNIAHGIMDARQGCLGANLFFICAVTKLLAISSKHCLEIMINSPELQTFTNPESDIVNIQE